MGCDLEVDTDRIRRSAQELRDAGELFRPWTIGWTIPSEHAAGAGAAGRQALRLITARTDQAVQSTHLLSTAAATLADRLDAAAGQFDAAEALCSAGG